MALPIQIASLFLLGITCYQDVRERSVSVILFPLLFICFAGLTILHTSLEAVYQSLPLSILFLGIQVGALYVYFWLRNRRYTPVIGESMGWGDVFFWLVACVLFSPANFILFFLSSLLFSLVLHLLLRFWFVNTYHHKVPLAGLQALYLAMLLMLQVWFTDIDLQDDYLVLGYLL